MKRAPVLERIAIRYKHLDPSGHVNNAVYLEFFDPKTDEVIPRSDCLRLGGKRYIIDGACYGSPRIERTSLQRCLWL